MGLRAGRPKALAGAVFAGFFAVAALSGAARAQAVGARTAAAARAAGCDAGTGEPSGDASVFFLSRLPGGDAGQQVLAGLTGDISADGLGDLCVAVLREDGGRFTRVAALRPGATPQPPAEVDPTTSRDIGVDTLAFRFAPDESAFLVRTTGEYNSTSTNVSWGRFYLFRRKGAQLALILDADAGETDIEKDSGRMTKNTNVVIRFSPQVTRGAYDLILAPKTGKGRARRYIWSGARYAAAAR